MRLGGQARRRDIKLLNDPLMPLAWTNSFVSASGKTARVFATTMGSSQDFQSEGFRRMLVNASYWAVGLEDKIRADSNMSIVGEFNVLPFRFGGAKKGVKPKDHVLD